MTEIERASSIDDNDERGQPTAIQPLGAPRMAASISVNAAQPFPIARIEGKLFDLLGTPKCWPTPKELVIMPWSGRLDNSL